LGLSEYDAGVLTSSKSLTAFFETTISTLSPGSGEGERKFAKPVSNWITGEVARLLNQSGEAGMDIGQSKFKPAHLADLVLLVEKGEISGTGAKQALSFAWSSGDAIAVIVKRENLSQVSDTGQLGQAVDEVILANPAQWAELCSGKDKIMGFFVGQIMKKTGGKANPALLQKLISEKLAKK